MNSYIHIYIYICIYVYIYISIFFPLYISIIFMYMGALQKKRTFARTIQSLVPGATGSKY